MQFYWNRLLFKTNDRFTFYALLIKRRTFLKKKFLRICRMKKVCLEKGVQTAVFCIQNYERNVDTRKNKKRIESI